MRALRFLALPVFAACATGVLPAALADDPKPVEAPATPAADPVLAKKKMDEADQRREEGRWTEAAKAYGEAILADDSLYLAHVRYQECVIAAGEGSFLAKDYDKLLEPRPGDRILKLHRLRVDPPAARLEALVPLVKGGQTDRHTLLEVGRAHLAAGDAAAAKKVLESLWVVSPDASEVLFLSVEALRRVGDLQAARLRLEGVLKKDPSVWEATLRLARLDLQEGKWDQAVQRADAVLSMRPSNVPALLVRSEGLSRAGKKEDARSALDSALRINPDDGEALVASADFTARTGTEETLKKAVEVYKKALALKGTPVPSLRAFYGLGWAFERLNMLPEAAAAYRECRLLAPMDAAVVNSIGVVFLKQKKFQDATAQFQTAIGLDPQNPEAYANRGAVADEQGDWNEAIKWYDKVLSLKGQEKNLRALLCIAFDYEALGSYKKAEEYLTKAKSVRPEDSEITTFLGDNQYFQHKWKVARKTYEEATRLDAKNRFAWRGLGLARYQDGEFKEAAEALEKAKELKKDDQVTLLVLGDLYASEKEVLDLRKALDNYEAYKKAGGNDPDVDQIIEEIKKELEAQKKAGG